eukprot:3672980-Ditylum_brightwellii.AAC.1
MHVYCSTSSPMDYVNTMKGVQNLGYEAYYSILFRMVGMGMYTTIHSFLEKIQKKKINLKERRKQEMTEEGITQREIEKIFYYGKGRITLFHNKEKHMQKQGKQKRGIVVLLTVSILKIHNVLRVKSSSSRAEKHLWAREQKKFRRNKGKLLRSQEQPQVTMISSANGGSDDEESFDGMPSELINDEMPPLAQLHHDLILLTNTVIM